MALPGSALLSLAQAARLIHERTREPVRRVREALFEAAIAGDITATGCVHASTLLGEPEYFAARMNPRTNVPPEAWGDEICWGISRVGLYSMVRFDRAEIERWLASAAQPEPLVKTGEAQLTPSGIRTTRAEAAEKACGEYLVTWKNEWLAKRKLRPRNKDAAFETTKAAVKHLGPLSWTAFYRQWGITVPPEWREAGAPKKDRG
jgi:hypothetical protein